MHATLPLFVCLAFGLGTTYAQDIPEDTARAAVVVDTSALEEAVTDTSLELEHFQSGKTRHDIGRYMSWGGLGMLVASTLTESPAMVGFGVLGIVVGIPLNGSGANDMIDAANDIRPDAEAEMSGWGTYAASWALMAGGVGLIIKGESLNNRNYNERTSMNMIAGGILSILGGASLQFVSWYQFSASAERAADTKDPQAYSLELSPAVYASRTRGIMPGMQLALRF
jgi:hypothetical protein